MSVLSVSLSPVPILFSSVDHFVRDPHDLASLSFPHQCSLFACFPKVSGKRQRSSSWPAELNTLRNAETKSGNCVTVEFSEDKGISEAITCTLLLKSSRTGEQGVNIQW